MNQSAEESLMALLEAMLTLAAGTEARRQQPKPTVNPGGYPEEQFLDVTEEERDELSCNICYQMLKETMQCVNHHKFCHSCLVVWSTTGEYANRVKCPVCRTRGYYFRNDAIDEKVGNKRMKCHLESCTWTGLAKYLSSHRHTTYGEEDAPSDAENKLPSPSRPGSSSIPRLEQVVPRAPPVTTARFVGTGLTTRGPTVETNHPQNVSSPRVSLLPGRAASRASTNSLSGTSQETVIDIGRGRGRRVSNGNATAGVLTSRRSIPPVRAAGTNRITFAHTRPTPNPNPNPAATSDSTANADASSNSNNANRASLTSTSDSTDGLANSIAAGGFTPRPPSAPRTSSNSINPRRLPRIINPLPPNSNSNSRPPQSSQITDSPAMPASSNNNNEVQTEPGTGTNLGNIRNHLQDSRNRLNNLMSSFTTELDRNRQEMMQFQHERETQRRDQLEEVRQLSQRLGQVAFELRRLLEHRRRMPSFSDSDSDED